MSPQLRRCANVFPGTDLHRLAEERSIAYHGAIAERLRDHPEILEMARQRVEGWLASREGARFYARKWAEVLKGDAASIAAFLVERSELATELRQSSPFRRGAAAPRALEDLARDTGALPARTMTRDQLEHLIGAAAVIADDDTIVVIGSQAVLGQFPDAPEPMRVSEEADLFPLHHPERADLIEGSIGELSPFHQTFGYYAQGVAEETAVLPEECPLLCEDTSLARPFRPPSGDLASLSQGDALG